MWVIITIYNSRNYTYLLGVLRIEFLCGHLQQQKLYLPSRPNLYEVKPKYIYNSRNYTYLLGHSENVGYHNYLQQQKLYLPSRHTLMWGKANRSTIVEIILTFQAVIFLVMSYLIYNSRNYTYLLGMMRIYDEYSHLQQQKLYLPSRLQSQYFLSHPSTIVEIILTFQASISVFFVSSIYNSRNYTYLLGIVKASLDSFNLQQQKLYLPSRPLNLGKNLCNLQQQKLYLPSRPSGTTSKTAGSTIVEIILTFQASKLKINFATIYNSRNYTYLLGSI